MKYPEKTCDQALSSGSLVSIIYGSFDMLPAVAQGFRSGLGSVELIELVRQTDRALGLFRLLTEVQPASETGSALCQASLASLVRRRLVIHFKHE
jgi:hypothetical protein